jgi:hypothetical protein
MTTNKLVFAALGAFLLMAGVAGASQTHALDHANDAARDHANEHSALMDNATAGNGSDAASDHGAPDAAKMCGEWRNHGDYVSDAAKDDGNNSAAGRSDIGKCHDEAEDAATNETAAPQDDEDDDEAEEGSEHGHGGDRADQRGRSDEARDEHPPRN